MKLLICTQAVDAMDPVLGFFHRWIEEFAKHAESVIVICLKEGEHSLPSNVRVLSLGKEEGRSRFKYAIRFYKYVWLERNNYDSIFVHMNQEYVLMAGFLWHIWKKMVFLWRNHPRGSWLTHIAGRFASVVYYTSPKAFVANFKNGEKMPIGIDSNQFSSNFATREPKSVLFLGRLDEIKYPLEFIEALDILREQEVSFTAHFYGDPTDPESKYAENVREAGNDLVSKGLLSFHEGVPHFMASKLFAKHDIYVNLTPSGSFDKTIGEALSSGCIVVCVNQAVADVIPNGCLVNEVIKKSVADSILCALNMSEEEGNRWRVKGRKYIVEEHSLSSLVERVVSRNETL